MTFSSTDIQTATHEDRHARKMANITRRALRLWEDGYAAILTMDGLYFRAYVVLSPERKQYTVRVSKLELPGGHVWGHKCSCPCFEQEMTCKHFQAVKMQIEQEEAQEAEYEARENNDDDRYPEF